MNKVLPPCPWRLCLSTFLAAPANPAATSHICKSWNDHNESCILTNHSWLLGLVNRETGYSHTWGSPHCGFRMPGVPSTAIGFSIRWLWQGSWSHHQLCFWAEFRSLRGSLGAQIGRNVFAEIANISNHQCLEWRMGQEMRAKGKQRFQLGTSGENHAENLPKRFTAQGSWGLC